MGKVCEFPFPKHVHNVVECVHLFTGELDMTAGNKEYHLVPGDTIICFPQMSHSYGESTPDMAGVCMIFEPDCFSEFTNTFHNMVPV